VLTALVLAGLLFVVNLARVAVLVTVGQVAGWQLTARMLHVPLGVLGFARRARQPSSCCEGDGRKLTLASPRGWPHPTLPCEGKGAHSFSW